MSSDFETLLREAAAEHRRRFAGKTWWAGRVFAGVWVLLGIGAFFLDFAAGVLVNGILAGFALVLWFRTAGGVSRGRDRRWIRRLRHTEFFLSLRPFARDHVTGKKAAVPEQMLHQLGFLGLLVSTVVRDQSMGQLLAEALEAEGHPLVAVGHPGDELPPPGLRTLYPTSDWQEAVLCLARRARGVVFETGGTAGLLWELEHIRREIPPSRVFMLISIDNDEERAWPQTQAVLRATGWEAPAAFPGQGSLLGFRADGRARMLAHESRSEEELAAALIAATVPEAEPEDLSAPPDLEEAIPEAAPEEAGWAWDARSGESGPVPGRDPAAEWALALNRDLFSAGPLGCALAWICLLVVAGIATWSGRALYRAHAVSGEGGRFVLLLFGLLAFLAGYGVYKALAPLTARLAARTAGHRLTWLGWGLAAGLPLWLFLLAALVRQDGDILAEARELLGLFR